MVIHIGNVFRDREWGRGIVKMLVNTWERWRMEIQREVGYICCLESKYLCPSSKTDDVVRLGYWEKGSGTC